VILAISTGTSLLGLVTSVWFLRRVYALRSIRRAIVESFWIKVVINPLSALAILALIWVGLIAAAKFLTADFYTILFGLDVATIPSFYFMLKVTFPEGFPLRGWPPLLHTASLQSISSPRTNRLLYQVAHERRGKELAEFSELASSSSSQCIRQGPT
jgi:hypothetical protein